MITPTDQDIGRHVIYQPHHAVASEEGVITSFNDKYVFVRYGGLTSAATRHEDLEWSHPR